MTPEAILQQAVDQINERIPEVHKARTEEFQTLGSITALGLMPKKQEVVKLGDNCKLYEHHRWVTKKYRNEGCAVYKLIRLLEEKTKGAERIFWRVEPKIDSCSARDFDPNYMIYRGFVRFSMS